MRRFPRRALAVWVLALVSLRAGAADYRSSFEAGIKAMDQRDWAAAARAFQAAVNDKPAEGGKVLIYGMRFSPYLPHYFLGVAYSNLGNCEAALAEFKESERQGAIQSLGEYRELARYRAQCEALAGSSLKPTAAVQRPTAVAESLPPTPIPRAVVPSPTAAPRVARAEPSPTRTTAASVTAVAAAEAELARARADAQTQIQAAERAAADLSGSHGQGDALDVWQSDPALRHAEEGARNSLEAARTLLAQAAGRKDPAQIRRARERAADAARQYAAVSKSLTDRVAQARVRKEKEARLAAFRELEERRAQARTLLAQQPRTPASPAVRQTREELQAALARVERLTSDRPTEELTRSSESIALLTASLQALARPVPAPPELLAGASAYFAGEYEKAAEILNAKTFTDPRAAAESRLLLAASRYSSWVLGGSVDAALRERAASDVRECVRWNAALTLNTRAFSPRFVKFFQEERSAAGHPGSSSPGPASAVSPPASRS